MPVDQARLRQLAPFIVPLLIAGAGWALLVRPQAAASGQAGRELTTLRPRLESVRRALMEAPPPELKIEPVKAFERQVTTGDPGRILEELSRLAPRARYRDLSIDATGEQVVVQAGGGPQVAGGVQLDPRFTLFRAPLTYLPVTMSFDADYAASGELLWRLRDLGTVVEIRNLDLKRAAPAPAGTAATGLSEAPAAPRADLHATLTLFAYARTADVQQAAGRGGPEVTR